RVVILPASFVDLEVGTGIVMSVPAHAPYDFIALEDLKKSEIGRKLGIENIVPRKIIDSEDYKGIPAEEACKAYHVENQSQVDKLEEATEEVYKKEFHKGRMIIGPFKGLSVKEAKEKTIELIKSTGALDYIWETTGLVVCRCGTKCHVKILENQWFLKYSDDEWKRKVKKCIENMKFYPEEIRQQFINTVDWLENKACARKTGLGTRLPWDKEWIVETLSDSTIYMSFYTIYPYLKEIPPEKVTDELFDFVFLGKGDSKSISKKYDIKESLLKKMREEFEYFYPVDLRASGKDLVQNHLTFYLFHHTAIWEEKYWPRAIAVNGFVNVAGEKMSKSKGNVIPLYKLLEEMGSDLVRINIVSSAENLDDADWRAENIKVFLERINFIFDVVKSLKKAKSKKMRNIDEFLVSKINKIGREVLEAYENLRFRTATQLLFFEFVNDLEWYFNRVGKIENANERVLKNVMKKFIPLISPLIPHLAEELWEMIGGKNFVFQEKIPTFEKFEEKPILLEGFLQSLIDDIKSVKKLVEAKPKEVDIIVAAEWKFDLVEKISKGVKVELKDLLGKFEDKEKESVAKLYKKIVSTKDIKLIPREDQLKILEEARDILEKEVEAKVIITVEENSGLEKAKQADPLKPAIYFSI
ncbi:MAG: leucine--tRNA ligase, partial [Sulfurihydrogenibium sp.]|nr:leucine--tRNA ligase [Sulfurihydrogenibium sp.]